MKNASIPPTPWRCDFVVRARFTSGRKRTANQEHGVSKIPEQTLNHSLRESCPKRSPTQPPLAGFSRLAFWTIGKQIVFIGKTACLRPTTGFPMRGSAARHQTLCAIDQAHCEVQKAQSRVTHLAAGDLRRAYKCRSLRERVPAAAVCVGQSASRSVRQANRSASFRRQSAIPIGNCCPAASVPAFAVARAGGGRRQRHELVGGQARRRSSDLEGASPKRAAYSREKVERREKPQPVAIAATESSGLALSSRWRARSSR